MYCRKCYTKLAPDFTICPRCGLVFDADNPVTYLARPFPDKWRIAKYVFITSIISIVAAFVVSTFQMAAASGH